MSQSLFFKSLHYRFFPVHFPKFVRPLFEESTFGQLLLHLEPYQVSMIEPFCGNSKSLTVFKIRISSYMFKRVLITWRYSGSCSQMFLRVGVLKIFEKPTGKYLRWNFFLIKLNVLNPATLFKKDSSTGVFQALSLRWLHYY